MNSGKLISALQFVSIVLIFIIVSVVISAGVWFKLGSNATYTPEPSNPFGDEYEEKSLIDIPRHTNVLIVGVDRLTATLTDFIVVGSYDKETGEVDFISIPRDTAISLNDKQHAELRQQGIYVPNTIKLNELNSYTKSLGIEYLNGFIEDMLGIQLDYYVKVDLNVLQDLVNAMGGVYFDVPQRMYYVDKAQGLYIDLQPGPQLLNSDQVEQLLRFRQYPMGDIDRIEVQQDFLTEMLDQLLSLDTFLSNPIEFITAVFKNVETNATVVDISKYIHEIPKIKIENITFQTAPIGNIGTYVYLNYKELSKVVDEIFYDIEPEPVVTENEEHINNN